MFSNQLDTVLDITKIKIELKDIKPELKDLRYLRTYTIDDKKTIEVDDAISFEDSNSSEIIWVHISNPAEFIKFDSPLEHIINKRSMSQYYSREIVTMFPRELNEKIFSLSPDKENVCLSLSVALKEDGSIENYNICRSLIQTDLRLDYDDLDVILDLQPKEEIGLVAINNILERRRLWRKNNGSNDIDEDLGVIYEDNDGPKYKVIENSKGRKLIEEAMILFGYLIAQYAHENQIPIPYRNQTQKKQLGAKRHCGGPYREHLNNFLIKESMNKSSINLVAKGHYGLGLDIYTQASSPIRRYVDLLIHFQILRFFRKKETINNDELQIRLDKYNKSCAESLEIIKKHRNKLVFKWFSQYPESIWEICFLKWLNKQKQIGLVYFTELKMDIVCIVDCKKDGLGNISQIRLQETIIESDLATFTENL